MLETLKLISFVSMAVAICFAGYAGYLIVNDSNEAGGVLGQPSKIDEFIATAKSGVTKEPDAKESLLVKQATAYSLRINPPAPPAPPKKKKTARKNRAPAVSKPSGPPPIAKFKVVGVSVAKNNVKNSKVLVDTLSQGLRWYSISDKIGHVEVAEINAGHIVINDGSKTYNMDVPMKKRVSLLKGDPDNPYRKVNKPAESIDKRPVMGKDRNKGKVRSMPVSKPVSTVAVESIPPVPSSSQIKENIDFIKQITMNPESMGLSEEEAASMGDMAQFLGELNKELEVATQREATEKADKRLEKTSKKKPAKPVSAEEAKANAEFLKKIATDPGAMGISKEEAKQLGDLEKFIKSIEADAKKEANEPAKKE